MSGRLVKRRPLALWLGRAIREVRSAQRWQPSKKATDRLRFPWWLLRKGPRRAAWRSSTRRAGKSVGRWTAGQAVAAAVLWRQSLRMLWVAASSRHSDLAAERPRRWKLSAPRLCLIWPKTGSIVAWRRV
jgi:hypothetical protein